MGLPAAKSYAAFHFAVDLHPILPQLLHTESDRS